MFFSTCMCCNYVVPAVYLHCRSLLKCFLVFTDNVGVLQQTTVIVSFEIMTRLKPCKNFENVVTPI